MNHLANICVYKLPVHSTVYPIKEKLQRCASPKNIIAAAWSFLTSILRDGYSAVVSAIEQLHVVRCNAAQGGRGCPGRGMCWRSHMMDGWLYADELPAACARTLQHDHSPNTHRHSTRKGIWSTCCASRWKNRCPLRCAKLQQFASKTSYAGSGMIQVGVQ